jgi:rubrerythrin
MVLEHNKCLSCDLPIKRNKEGYNGTSGTNMVELRAPSESVRTQLSVLYAAVAIEEFGIQFYRGLEGCVKDDTGKALMRGLARDELGHKEIIEKEIERISRGLDVSGVQASKRYLGVIPDKVFPFMERNVCLTIKEEIQALEVGIDVEKRSIQMYDEAAQSATEPGVKERLTQLSGIEQGHLKLLQDNVHMLRLEGSWYGYSPILEG